MYSQSTHEVLDSGILQTIDDVASNGRPASDRLSLPPYHGRRHHCPCHHQNLTFTLIGRLRSKSFKLSPLLLYSKE